ncbi:unnamed protein product [Durusdinium trenchii]|uniref:Uncharacterized protein n=1 Tax=Durusdinium trenchii TaxID=1381693 RepID=A0ABP0L7I2_9DINO
MVLDNDCVPLQRSWCLFELLQTRYVAPRLKSGYEATGGAVNRSKGLLLCTPSGVLQWGNAHVDTVVRLAEKVGEIRSSARFGGELGGGIRWQDGGTW